MGVGGAARRASAGAALLAALAIAVPASAQAAGWVTGPPVSPADRLAQTPLAAVSSSGERIVAWEQETKASSPQSEGIGVRIAPPGGDLGPEQLLSATHDAFEPAIAAGADGTVALAWLGDNATVHVARHTPGQAGFVEAAPLTVGGGADPSGPVALSVQDGSVYIAFQARAFGAGDTFTTTIQAARLDAGSGAVLQLPGSGPGGVLAQASFVEASPFLDHTVASPTIAVSRGTIHVAWQEQIDQNPLGLTRVWDATRPVDGAAFTTNAIDQVTSDETRAQDVSAQLVAQGDRLDIAWLRLTGQIASQDLNAPTPAIRTIPTGNGFPFTLHAGLDSAGSLLLAWDQTGVNVFETLVDAAVVPADGPGAGPQPLTAHNASFEPESLSVAPDGGALLLTDRRVLNSTSDFASQVQAFVRPPGGAFGALESVSGLRDRVGESAFDVASGAIGAGGQAVAAWLATDGSSGPASRVFVSERDATPPSIDALSVPGRVTPGTPVALAVSASDAQSGVSVSWDFGDGSSATGAAVTHAYGARGSYTVTVRATDGAGNVATRTATITVADPDPPVDRTPPTIAHLKLTHTRFRVAAGATATVARRHAAAAAPAGTAFTLRLDERATLVLTLTGTLAHHRRVSPGTLIRTARGPGAVTLAFSGRVGSTRLAPGRYVATVTAIDAAGNRSRPQTVAFTVVSR